jgi:CRISPR type III-B/RAMP module-associated protein Cmr3
VLTLRVRIEPVEPMLFGDNRSARSGESHAIGDQDPSPVTLYGSIGARIAHQLGARGQRRWGPAEPVLGPFKSEIESSAPDGEKAELLGYVLCDAAGKLWFPKPLHLRVDRIGNARVDRTASDYFAIETLRPSDASLLSSLPAGWRPLVSRTMAVNELEEDLLVEETLLAAILSGSLVPRSLADSARPRSSLYDPEPRLGLAMRNATNTAVPGRLFARPYRRFRGEARSAEPGWESAGFLAWFRVRGLASHPESFFDGTAFLGGDRRRARLRFSPEAGVQLANLRDAVMASVHETRGYLVYLLTPARIPAEGTVMLQGEVPVGGAVGRTVFASGWRGAADRREPRPLLPLIPAGSVFFFEWSAGKENEEARRQWIADHWLCPLGARGGSAGFGRILLGVWR